MIPIQFQELLTPKFARDICVKSTFLSNILLPVDKKFKQKPMSGLSSVL